MDTYYTGDTISILAIYINLLEKGFLKTGYAHGLMHFKGVLHRRRFLDKR